ncbi:MAG: hypothetical protein HOC34_00160 [Candidatus Magasanikbacteria bacterium]|nr:hypothetical protein [Candidatus Magasanikbacteria bacterium]MBT4350637.1 hypothetical protein [Candidatus Magasanikbacteria bacterium]MBT4541363.1 hypothetical protein [Candidatus Magasanikbacteria bacterium]MBT6253097.1 hypothetical protein [Candidatus Magasanikbacteria bacterium]
MVGTRVLRVHANSAETLLALSTVAVIHALGHTTAGVTLLPLEAVAVVHTNRILASTLLTDLTLRALEIDATRDASAIRTNLPVLTVLVPHALGSTLATRTHLTLRTIPIVEAVRVNPRTGAVVADLLKTAFGIVLTGRVSLTALYPAASPVDGTAVLGSDEEAMLGLVVGQEAGEVIEVTVVNLSADGQCPLLAEIDLASAVEAAPTRLVRAKLLVRDVVENAALLLVAGTGLTRLTRAINLTTRADPAEAGIILGAVETIVTSDGVPCRSIVHATKFLRASLLRAIVVVIAIPRGTNAPLIVRVLVRRIASLRTIAKDLIVTKDVVRGVNDGVVVFVASTDSATDPVLDGRRFAVHTKTIDASLGTIAELAVVALAVLIALRNQLANSVRGVRTSALALSPFLATKRDRAHSADPVGDDHRAHKSVHEIFPVKRDALAFLRTIRRRRGTTRAFAVLERIARIELESLVRRTELLVLVARRVRLNPRNIVPVVETPGVGTTAEPSVTEEVAALHGGEIEIPAHQKVSSVRNRVQVPAARATGVGALKGQDLRRRVVVDILIRAAYQGQRDEARNETSGHLEHGILRLLSESKS